MFNANEDMFLQAFDSTPKLNLATQKKLELEMAKVTSIISNPNAEWDHRVQAIKHFRSLVQSGAAESEAFFTQTLKSLEIPFQNNICDLRSQVVRETCITIAFLSCRLQQKFSRMAETLLASLIKLIPNSAKIVSSSAFVALCFIIQSTHNSRLIPIIRYQLSISKSKEIHRGLCDIAERMISVWSPQVIERHINDFVEVLRLGIHNSDEMARQSARRAFNVFAEHFREAADHLYNSLDQTRQRMLNNLNHGGGSTLSMNGYSCATTTNLHLASQSSALHHPHHHPPSSSSSGASHVTSRIQPPTASMAPPHSSISHNNNNSNNNNNSSSVNLVSRLKNSLTISSNGHQHPSVISSSPSRIRTPTARSTSAIDVAAQRRARARAVYLSSMYTKPRQIGATATSQVMTPTKASHIPSSSSSPFSNHHQQPTNKQHVVHAPATHTSYQQQHVPHHQLSSASATNHLIHHHHHTNNHHLNNSNKPACSPNVAQQQLQLQQLQQQQAASAEKRDGVALSKAASYLLSVISNNSISESQIVTTIKYFNSLIEKHPADIVSQFLTELMPPLVVGIDNAAICVRKASVFAMVAIHAKVGLKQMEPYLTNLTMTQRKLLEVYIKKFKDENRQKSQPSQLLGSQQQEEGYSLSSESDSMKLSSSSSTTLISPAHQQQQQQVSSPDLI